MCTAVFLELSCNGSTISLCSLVLDEANMVLMGIPFGLSGTVASPNWSTLRSSPTCGCRDIACCHHADAWSQEMVT